MAEDVTQERADYPWDYKPEDAATLPIGRRLLYMDDIRFTQRQVNDSFSHERRPVMELINSVLDLKVRQRSIPLIRVAWHEGAFWSIDNRRLFCYKHCGFRRLCVEVCRWDDNHEFEMKWKNGAKKAESTEKGRKAGMVQRLQDTPLPRSEVINHAPGETQVSLWMSSEEQKEHDEKRLRFLGVHAADCHKEDELARNIQKPWQYVVYMGPEDWRPATVIEAHADGTFTALVLLSRSPASFSVKPWCGVEEFKDRPTADEGVVDNLPALPASLDDKTMTFIVPRSVQTKMSRSWCAICKQEFASLRQHEKDKHRDAFRCSTCHRSFEGSGALRKHSRSKMHEISTAFMQYLEPSEADSNETARDGRPEEGRRCSLSRRSTARSCVTRQDHLGDEGCSSTGDESNSDELLADSFFVPRGASSKNENDRGRCMLCSKVFNQKDELKQHEEAEHLGELKCLQCGKGFASCKDLRKHSRSTSHRISMKFRLPQDCQAQPVLSIMDEMD